MTRKQKKVLIRILVAAVLVLVLLFIPIEYPWLKFALFMVPYLVIGYDILRKAFLGVIHGEVFDENFLMAVATVGAILLGEYTEGVAVMLFYQIGELFQSYAVGKSRGNIAKLMDIRPDYANIEVDGRVVQVAPDDVEIGTLITVMPGEKVPIDGTVEEGEASLNTSALTGESLPRQVGAGDQVISGSVNMSGVLKLRTTKEFGESTVSKILELVENSSMKKSRSENFITRFARFYTPAVCYGALALALLPPVFCLVFGYEPHWSMWVTRALTTLVISCPCALVISIPLSFFGGIGAASAKGTFHQSAVARRHKPSVHAGADTVSADFLHILHPVSVNLLPVCLPQTSADGMPGITLRARRVLNQLLLGKAGRRFLPGNLKHPLRERPRLIADHNPIACWVQKGSLPRPASCIRH